MMSEATDRTATVVKRKDPNYSPVTAHIPKVLAKRLRMYCTEYEVTIAETVEKAVDAYLDSVGYPKEIDRTQGK